MIIFLGQNKGGCQKAHTTGVSAPTPYFPPGGGARRGEKTPKPPTLTIYAWCPCGGVAALGGEGTEGVVVMDAMVWMDVMDGVNGVR